MPAPDDVLLLGAVVQRVDVAPGLLVVRLRAPGENAWVLLTAQHLGLASARPSKGSPLEGDARERARLRAEIGSARVVALLRSGIVLDCAGTRRLVAFARDGSGAIASRILAEGERFEALRERDREALLELGAGLGQEAAGDQLRLRQVALSRALDKAVARLSRRIEAVEGDLARIAAAQEKALRAAQFSAEAGRVPRGATSMTVTDWASGEPTPMTMKLDPASSAREQLEAIFRRARRMKLGREVADRRLAEAEKIRDTLASLASSVLSSTELGELDAITQRARAVALRDFALHAPTPSPKAPKQQRRLAYRTFTGARGARILVGRGGADNDELTLHVARPHDLWLHAKERTGAHVIVPLPKGSTCPGDLLVDAALLAVHFSDVRGEATAEVQTAPRRYLRKPKGSAPGFVVVTQEKVLTLRAVPERLGELLASEIDPPR